MKTRRQLKLCPFCGKTPELSFLKDESLWSHNIVIWSFIRCYECDIEFSECEDDNGEAVIKKWNTRIK